MQYIAKNLNKTGDIAIVEIVFDQSNYYIKRIIKIISKSKHPLRKQGFGLNIHEFINIQITWDDKDMNLGYVFKPGPIDYCNKNDITYSCSLKCGRSKHLPCRNLGNAVVLTPVSPNN
jgi:hypothetical protein